MRIVKDLLIVLVILWGLLALLVRSGTPFIADYRDELADLLSEHMGAPVDVGAFRARWHGLAPLLELQDVRIGDDDASIQIEQVAVDLELGRLITGPPADALRLTIDGMELTVVRERSGQMHIEGVGMIGRQAGQTSEMRLVPRGLRLLNTRVVWIDRKAGKPPFTIDDVSITFNRNGRALDMRARVETESGNADLSARLDGFLATREWGGDIYLKIDRLDVADLAAQYLPDHYGLHGLQLDMEIWTRWQDAAPTAAQGSFELRDLRLRPKTPDAMPLNLVRAGADFTVRHDRDDLRVGLRNLLLAFRGHQWPFSNLAFALSRSPDGGHRVRAAADYLRLDDIARILRVRVPVQDLRRPREHLRPRGEVHDIRFQADLGADTQAWRLQGDFSGVTTAPWGEIPGIANLSGNLHAQQDHLALQVDSRDAGIRFRDLFRAPINLSELTGRVDVLREGDRWRLHSDHLIANTPDIDTRTRLHLEHRPDHPLFLDLQTDFSDGDASHALRYYPTRIMDEDVVDWLDTSIISGRVPGGTALVYGTLDDFPYETTRNGVFQVIFDTRDLELDYHTGWPKLEHLDAHLRVVS